MWDQVNVGSSLKDSWSIRYRYMHDLQEYRQACFACFVDCHNIVQEMTSSNLTKLIDSTDWWILTKLFNDLAQHRATTLIDIIGNWKYEESLPWLGKIRVREGLLRNSAKSEVG